MENINENRSKSEKGKKSANTKQFEALVEYMENNKDLTTGLLSSVNYNERRTQLNEDMCRALNLLGPPSKGVVQWLRVWYDLKSRVRDKLRKGQISRKQTGGGPPKLIRLTSIEERLCSLLNLMQAVEGLPKAVKFGLPSTSNATEELQDSGELPSRAELPEINNNYQSQEEMSNLNLTNEIDNEDVEIEVDRRKDNSGSTMLIRCSNKSLFIRNNSIKLKICR